MPVTVVRQLRDFAVGAVLAILIATCAFVAVRNRELAEKQIDLAARAADSLTTDSATPPGVHAVLLGPTQPSSHNRYLSQRRVRDGETWRALSASGGPDDKLFYDAATRYERTPPRTTAEWVEAHARRIRGVADAFAAGLPARAKELAAKPAHRLVLEELLRDGSGRAIAIHPMPDLARGGDLAIAVTPSARPAPYPWLVIIGVLGLGLAIAAASALASGPNGRAARFGSLAGIGVLAIPCVLWQAPIATTAILIVAAAMAMAQRVGMTDRFWSGARKNRTALSFLAPAAVAMLVLVAAPFVIGLILGFYDHHSGEWTFVGLDNFGEILSGGGRPLDDPLNFWFILGVTVLWTIANVALHVTIGVLLALALSRTWLRGKGVLRMLFILPWAVPNYITALIWKGMFTSEHGAIASILDYCGLDNVNWFGDWATAFSANVITNTWLGFPFMMVVALGALETIPKELYEAAAVDGASAWQRFRHITLPHLRPALGPAVALGSIWTFNMFNVIFLVSGGKPGNSTNILVTDAYRWAFERGERYGMAAAYATIIFAILLLWTIFGSRLVRSKEEAAS